MLCGDRHGRGDYCYGKRKDVRIVRQVFVPVPPPQPPSIDDSAGDEGPLHPKYIKEHFVRAPRFQGRLPAPVPALKLEPEEEVHTFPLELLANPSLRLTGEGTDGGVDGRGVDAPEPTIISSESAEGDEGASHVPTGAEETPADAAAPATVSAAPPPPAAASAARAAPPTAPPTAPRTAPPTAPRTAPPTAAAAADAPSKPSAPIPGAGVGFDEAEPPKAARRVAMALPPLRADNDTLGHEEDEGGLAAPAPSADAPIAFSQHFELGAGTRAGTGTPPSTTRSWMWPSRSREPSQGGSDDGASQASSAGGPPTPPPQRGRRPWWYPSPLWNRRHPRGDGRGNGDVNGGSGTPAAADATRGRGGAVEMTPQAGADSTSLRRKQKASSRERAKRKMLTPE